MPVDDRVPGPADRPIAGYLTADWHFPERSRKGPWAHASVGGDARYALDQVVALCVADGADLYAAGDIFDGPDPTPESVADLYSALRPVYESGLSVYYVLGNHERGRDWLLPFGPAAVRLEGGVVDTPLGTVTGMSYVHPSEFAAAVAKQPTTAVGLYHQTWAELVRAGRTFMRDLPAHALAVCGDVHVQSAVPRSSTGPLLSLSPGPLTPQSVSEFDNKPVVYAATAGLAVVTRPVKARQFRYLTAATADDFERALVAVSRIEPDPTLPEEVARPFVSVAAPPDADVAVLAELTRVAEKAGAVLRVTTSRPAGGAKRADGPAARADSLADAIAAWNASPGVRSMAASVTATDDPAAVLRNEYNKARGHNDTRLHHPL